MHRLICCGQVDIHHTATEMCGRQSSPISSNGDLGLGLTFYCVFRVTALIKVVTFFEYDTVNSDVDSYEIRRFQDVLHRKVIRIGLHRVKQVSHPK